MVNLRSLNKSVRHTSLIFGEEAPDYVLCTYIEELDLGGSILYNASMESLVFDRAAKIHRLWYHSNIPAFLHPFYMDAEIHYGDDLKLLGTCI